MNREKGFTLIELMVVIVVAGILAAMFMFSTTEAVTTAKANNIITDLQSLKKATLSWYADNRSNVKAGDYKTSYEVHYNSKKKNFEGFTSEAGGAAEIIKYLDNNALILKKMAKLERSFIREGYYFTCIDSRGDRKGDIWYVGYCFNEEDTKVKEKVAKRAASLGLIGGPNNARYAHPDKPARTFNSDDKIVWLHILTL